MRILEVWLGSLTALVTYSIAVALTVIITKAPANPHPNPLPEGEGVGAQYETVDRRQDVDLGLIEQDVIDLQDRVAELERRAGLTTGSRD